MSLSSPTDLTRVPLQWIPSQWDFSRYAELLDWQNGSGKRFLAAMLNSLIIATSATVIALFAGVLAAYAFSRRNASMLLMLVIMVSMTPVVSRRQAAKRRCWQQRCTVLMAEPAQLATNAS